jgi:hypothetical protein
MMVGKGIYRVVSMQWSDIISCHTSVCIALCSENDGCLHLEAS